jgi:myo-inositol 2-dehydrogenase/D-chiro-inositol 1-dehydrogenase
MLRFGLIGCGRHGERYLRHVLADVPGATAVALWRRDAAQAQRLAANYGVMAERELEALLDRRDVDAVIIATPPACHARELELALAAGKPVLVEKPLAESLAAAEAILARTATFPEAIAMVAHTLRYNATLQLARTLSSNLGAVHRLRLQQRLEPSGLAWQEDAAVAGGGSVLLTGVHLFDLLRWLLGSTPDAVTCRMLAVEGAVLENAFDACFEYEASQILAGTEVSKFSTTRSGTLEVVGTQAQLLVDYGRGTITRVRGRELELVSSPGDLPTLPRILQEFVRVARREIEVPIPLRDGVEAVRMAEACVRSHRLERRVRLEECGA